MKAIVEEQVQELLEQDDKLKLAYNFGLGFLKSAGITETLWPERDGYGGGIVFRRREEGTNNGIYITIYDDKGKEHYGGNKYFLGYKRTVALSLAEMIDTSDLQSTIRKVCQANGIEFALDRSGEKTNIFLNTRVPDEETTAEVAQLYGTIDKMISLYFGRKSISKS